MTIIANPTSAMSRTSDYRTGKSDNGTEINYGKTVRLFRANAAITKGFIVDFVPPAKGAPLSVTTSAANSYLTAGVAEASAAEGELVPVCVEGSTFAVAAGTHSAGAALGANSDGKAAAVTVSASTPVGGVIAIGLAGGTANTLGPVYVQHV